MTVRTATRPRVRLTGRAALLLLVVTVFGVFLTVPAREYLAERGHIAALERQARGLERGNAALQSRIGKLHDPLEMERLARECLGMVKEGEIAFVTGPRTGAGGPAAC